MRVVGAKVRERNEAFTLNVFSPTGAMITHPNGSGSIRNDDK